LSDFVKRKMIMKANLALHLSLVAAGILVPTLVVAGHPNPSTYAQFTLSATDIAALSDTADTACQSQAARTPNDLAPQVACFNALTTRLEARVKSAVRRNMVRSNSAKQRAFLASQQAWEASRDATCTAKAREELNPSSNSFGLAVSACISKETYGRALWIERNGR
jgi:uncharacterized protein YecT (DUF1311 family)